MDAEQTRQAAAVMIAWAGGKTVELRPAIGPEEPWKTVFVPHWNWQEGEFRIAPEPMEVEVWVHPDGSIFSKCAATANYGQFGYTLRRATIHPADQ